MRVFCTACGAPQEAEPGASVDCSACAAHFEIPRDLTDAPLPPTPSRAPPPDVAPATDSGSLSAPLPRPAAPLAVGGAQPESLFERPRTNNWAIASLASGLCCIVPVLSPLGGVVCSVIALQQINEDNTQRGKGLAIAGMIFGLLSGTVTLITLVNLLH